MSYEAWCDDDDGEMSPQLEAMVDEGWLDGGADPGHDGVAIGV